MAEAMRHRTVANPGRRRNRKLSDKQIAIFGTRAQKAALKARRSRKRVGAKSNGKRRAARRHRPARRKNPGGEIIGYTLANPAKKKGQKTMAKKRTRRRASSAGARTHRRRTNRRRPALRTNPGGHRHRRRTNRRRHVRRNPSIGGTSFGGLVTNAVFVIAGALGSKLLTQMVLGTNNTGIFGYGGNAAAGVALWFLADKVLKNRAAANGIIAGTAVQIVLRLINDYTPFGQYVANLGMGDYQAQAFVTPQVLEDPYNSARIKIPGAWQPRALPAADMAAGAGVGMGGPLYSGRSDLY